jgi:Flp pilus assembly protein TadG
MKLFRHLRRLRRNENGVGAVEFALIAPLLLTFIIGVAQLGTLFMANAGLRSSVAEGARYASIYPRPLNDQIIARINERLVGLRSEHITGPTITTAADGSSITITMSYAVPLDFIFFQTSPVTLSETRVVPTYTTAAETPATSAGGTTTPPATSAGGTTPPATSAGGTTTPPATSAGGTSNGGTSNGGSNSNGGGHGHGSNGGSNSNGGH